MINNVFYTQNRTYIADDKGNEVTTDNFSFGEALNFARKTQARFDYDMIENNDTKDMNDYLISYHSQYTHRNIIEFILTCNDYGISSIIKRDFNIKDIEKIIHLILKEYNSDTELYNMEAYGTDTYIASYMQIVLKECLESTNDVITSEKIKLLLKTLDTDDYSLDTFLNKIKTVNDEVWDILLIKNIKNSFNNDYDMSSKAIKDYIDLLIEFGGIYTNRIAQAMNKVFDDIIENKPDCDRQGLIEAFRNDEKWCE